MQILINHFKNKNFIEANNTYNQLHKDGVGVVLS